MTVYAIDDWNHETFVTTVLASKRNANITPKQFEAIQERKKKAIKRIESYLKQKFGQADPLVVRAFAEVPREYFVYHYEKKTLLSDRVYEDSPNPIPIKIGYASSISDYLGQAYMTQMVAPKPGEVALEIGTGSGFQAAVLSRICREVYTIEIVKPLGEAVKGFIGHSRGS